LPEDFAKIPSSSPASGILSSVPGTDEAKDAVLIAKIPTVMEIDPKSAAAQAKVSYRGDPQFAHDSRQSGRIRIFWGSYLRMVPGARIAPFTFSNSA
jgi:hypothetical protein